MPVKIQIVMNLLSSQKQPASKNYLFYRYQKELSPKHLFDPFALLLSQKELSHPLAIHPSEEVLSGCPISILVL